MIKAFKVFLIFILLTLTALLNSCKKETVPPVAITNEPILVGITWATLAGTIKAGDQSVENSFEYGETSFYGKLKNADPFNIGAHTNIYVSARLADLKASTVYHYRIMAVTSDETIYGSDVTFTTNSTGAIVFNPDLTYGSVIDADDNVYKTIRIGTQTWMAENLKTTKYNDDSEIPLITSNTSWDYTAAPGYCWYNNDVSTFKDYYGALYNWYAVSNGKLCPAGWHVPADEEWVTLLESIGGENIAGGKLKEPGTLHWRDTTSGTDNESGFTALPGGSRDINGPYSSSGFHRIEASGYWWSSSESSLSTACFFQINDVNDEIIKSNNAKQCGYSVRCVKD